MQLAAPIASPPFVADAIRQLDWLHEVVGTLENEGAEYLDTSELGLGVHYARRAADLLTDGGAVEGLDTAGAAQAALGAAKLVGTAVTLLTVTPDPTQVADRLMDLGSKADAFVHEAYEALGTARD